jgi:elongation factor P--(R)-beta-lysine ligase
LNRERHAIKPEKARQRARLIDAIRRFFARRDVLEVSTPVVTDSGVTDVHIESLALADGRFLRTSHEYAHKRLLAAGVGDLYELGPVFRAGEHGRHHRKEFLMLEWYRIGWDWSALAAEVVELVREVTPGQHWTDRSIAWRELMLEHAGLDPTSAGDEALRAAAVDAPANMDRFELLDWLFATRLQPALPDNQLTVVHDFPASQAALARLKPGQPQYAERFEVFAGNLELANGYRELTDPAEQRLRFEADNRRRQSLGRRPMPVDRNLLAALEAGLPECAGVALGVDRLMMLAQSASDIADVRFFE